MNIGNDRRTLRYEFRTVDGCLTHTCRRLIDARVYAVLQCESRHTPITIVWVWLDGSRERRTVAETYNPTSTASVQTND